MGISNAQFRFPNIHSIDVTFDEKEDGTIFLVDPLNNTEFQCCPTCLEPYMGGENKERGCPNSYCPKYNKENFPYWSMTDYGPELNDPWLNNRKSI